MKTSFRFFLGTKIDVTHSSVTNAHEGVEISSKARFQKHWSEILALFRHLHT